METDLLEPTLQNVLDQKTLKWIFCGKCFALKLIQRNNLLKYPNSIQEERVVLVSNHIACIPES